MRVPATYIVRLTRIASSVIAAMFIAFALCWLLVQSSAGRAQAQANIVDNGVEILAADSTQFPTITAVIRAQYAQNLPIDQLTESELRVSSDNVPLKVTKIEAKKDIPTSLIVVLDTVEPSATLFSEIKQGIMRALSGLPRTRVALVAASSGRPIRMGVFRPNQPLDLDSIRTTSGLTTDMYSALEDAISLTSQIAPTSVTAMRRSIVIVSDQGGDWSTAAMRTRPLSTIITNAQPAQAPIHALLYRPYKPGYSFADVLSSGLPSTGGQVHFISGTVNAEIIRQHLSDLISADDTGFYTLTLLANPVVIQPGVEHRLQVQYIPDEFIPGPFATRLYTAPLLVGFVGVAEGTAVTQPFTVGLQFVGNPDPLSFLTAIDVYSNGQLLASGAKNTIRQIVISDGLVMPILFAEKQVQALSGTITFDAVVTDNRRSALTSTITITFPQIFDLRAMEMPPALSVVDVSPQTKGAADSFAMITPTISGLPLNIVKQLVATVDGIPVATQTVTAPDVIMPISLTSSLAEPKVFQFRIVRIHAYDKYGRHTTSGAYPLFIKDTRLEQDYTRYLLALVLLALLPIVLIVVAIGFGKHRYQFALENAGNQASCFALNVRSSGKGNFAFSVLADRQLLERRVWLKNVSAQNRLARSRQPMAPQSNNGMVTSSSSGATGLFGKVAASSSALAGQIASVGRYVGLSKYVQGSTSGLRSVESQARRADYYQTTLTSFGGNGQQAPRGSLDAAQQDRIETVFDEAPTSATLLSASDASDREQDIWWIVNKVESQANVNLTIKISPRIPFGHAFCRMQLILLQGMADAKEQLPRMAEIAHGAAHNIEQIDIPMPHRSAWIWILLFIFWLVAMVYTVSYTPPEILSLFRR